MGIKVRKWVDTSGEVIGWHLLDENGEWLPSDGIVWYQPERDWNQLMPVVKKIADLLLNKEWENLQEAVFRWKPIANELPKAESENVWFCVVKFIEWFNKQNYITSNPQH